MGQAVHGMILYAGRVSSIRSKIEGSQVVILQGAAEPAGPDRDDVLHHLAERPHPRSVSISAVRCRLAARRVGQYRCALMTCQQSNTDQQMSFLNR